MLSNPLETYALLFGAVFVAAFLYYWLWLLHPQGVGARHFQEKRYQEAAETFQKVLGRRPSPGIEADTRRRLADTLEILGRTQEAAGERERAAAIIARSPLDAMTQRTQGDLLKRKHRHDEACAAYSEALTRTPSLDKQGRAQIMARLALAHYEAARPAETVRWAQSALASQPDSVTRLSMERMSGVGYADQGDLEQAEHHYREALNLSQRSGDPQNIARDLGILAGIYQKRGQFEEAIATSHEARKTFADPTRLSYSMEAECLCDMGRFEEARAVIRQSCDTPASDKPWGERRIRAIRALGRAWLEAEADDPSAAQAALDEARAGFGAEDGRLILWCDATDAHVRAKRGRDDEARRLMKSVRARLLDFGTDQATLKTVYAQTGRAALCLGDLGESLRLWRACLDCRPFPYALPTAHFHLGETLRRLDEADAARASFRQAVSLGIDSLDARRAQARLDEIGG